MEEKKARKKKFSKKKFRFYYYSSTITQPFRKARRAKINFFWFFSQEGFKETLFVCFWW